MAHSVREVLIANPARKRGGKGRKNVAKRMTLKQKLHFGTARQRAAAKSSLKSKRTRKRNAARRKPVSHRKRTAPKRKNPAVRRRRKAVARAKPRHARRQNIGEIISLTLGNPAKKRRKTMAAGTKKRRRRAASKSNAGTRRRRKNPGRRMSHHRRRSNPGMGRGMLTRILMLGGGATAGATLSGLGTQAVLGASNVGVMGYAGNLVATFVLAWLAHTTIKNPDLSAGVLAGGIGALMKRVIGDYSLLGSFSASLGMGDYLATNFVTPQYLPNAATSAMSANGFFPQIAAPIVNSGGGGAPAPAGVGDYSWGGNLW
jgi:hypothetical protein